MINRIIRASLENRALVLLLTVMLDGRRRALGAAHAGRRAARPLGRAGHRAHALSGPGAARRRRPGHLSAHDGTALRAGRDHGARLLVLRRLVRQRAVRRWHRSVLGAFARARVPEPGDGPPAGRRAARARARCHGRRLDLPVRARSTARARTTSRSCAACRTGSSSSSCRRSTAWPRSRRSAAWSSSTRWWSIRCACAATASR